MKFGLQPLQVHQWPLISKSNAFICLKINTIILNLFSPLASSVCLGYSTLIPIHSARLLLADLFLIMVGSVNWYIHRIFYNYIYIKLHIYIYVINRVFLFLHEELQSHSEQVGWFWQLISVDNNVCKDIYACKWGFGDHLHWIIV